LNQAVAVQIRFNSTANNQVLGMDLSGGIGGNLSRKGQHIIGGMSDVGQWVGLLFGIVFAAQQFKQGKIGASKGPELNGQQGQFQQSLKAAGTHALPYFFNNNGSL
jgi:hypothetical protein